MKKGNGMYKLIISLLIVIVGVFSLFIVNKQKLESNNFEDDEYYGDKNSTKLFWLAKRLEFGGEKFLTEYLEQNNNGFYYSYTFDKYINEMEKIADTNLYAKEFTRVVSASKYNDLSEVQKMYLDYVIRRYFYNGTIPDDVPDITTAYVANDVNFDNYKASYLFVRYENITVDNFYLAVIKFTDNKSENFIESNEFEFKDDTLCEINNFPGYCLEKEKINLKEIDINEIKQVFVDCKDLIDFMKDYSQTVYTKLLKNEIEEWQKNIKTQVELSKSIPRVGMTTDEVKLTKWDEPDEINKDLYAWDSLGTTEQWIYNNKGYVYLTNGIVTSVIEK